MRRTILIVAAILLLIMLIAPTAAGGGNPYGISDKRQLTFSEPVRVGEVLLPKGQYELRHTMEGQEHVMVFTQLRAKQPAQARVKCTLVNLDKPLQHDLAGFKTNAAGERVLTQLGFKGDRAEHRF